MSYLQYLRWFGNSHGVEQCRFGGIELPEMFLFLLMKPENDSDATNLELEE